MSTHLGLSQSARRAGWSFVARALVFAGCMSAMRCSSDSGTAAGNQSAAGTGFVPAPPASAAGGTGGPGAAGVSAPPSAGNTSIGTAGLGAAGMFAGTTAGAAASGAAMAGSGSVLATAGSGAGSTAGAPMTAGTGVGAAGGGGEPGAAGTAGSSAAASDVMGCEGTKLLAVPDDPGALGPWPVGVKTVKLQLSAGMSTVEVWYPAMPGSEGSTPKATYDLTAWLSPSDKAKIPASDNAPQPCECYRDLPIDSTHGPYPAVVFAHGLASFRTASLTTMTQWASRGFIVLAADHLGYYLTDYAAGSCGGTASGALGDYPGDIAAEVAALTSNASELSFLGSSVDTKRIAVGGHSMGAGIGATASSSIANVQVIILLAELLGAAPAPSSSLKYVLSMAGMNDQVTGWAATVSAYTGSPMPKRLVGIEGGDHLDVIDICSQKDAMGRTSLDVGAKNGVCAIGAVAALAQCGAMKDPLQGPGIVNYVSTAVLEETLHCQDRAAALADAAVKAKFPAIAEYQHAP